MNRHFLDPDTLLGRVVSSKDNYEIVHLSLKEGNEVPAYKNEADIIIFVISGRVMLVSDGEYELKSPDLVELEAGREHSMVALSDCQLLIIKAGRLSRQF